MSKVAYAIFKEDLQGPNAVTLRRVIADNLVPLSPNSQDSGSLWVMLESVAEFRFEEFQSGTNWADWAAGRIFGRKGELRFRRRGDFVHVVLLTDHDGANLRHMGQVRDLQGHTCSEQCEHLWRGKPEQPTKSFIETRLPRGLEYPVPRSTTQPKLKVKTYARDGVPEFVRFCEVTG